MMLINDIAFDKDTPQVIETALEQLRVHILGLDNKHAFPFFFISLSSTSDDLFCHCAVVYEFN
jgi:hypothetical protein